MKYKSLLKTFLVLTLLAISSGQVYASEVIGNLSSSTTQNNQGGGSSGSEVTGTVGNGSTSGNVGSGSEVGGTVNSGALTGNVGSGSEVSGTINNGSISGNVSGGTTSGSSGGSSGGSGRNRGSTGTVLGASTVGTTYTPGFPATGLELNATKSILGFLGLLVSFLALTMYAHYRTRKIA